MQLKTKSFKGHISNARKIYIANDFKDRSVKLYGPNLYYMIAGNIVDHPEFDDWIRTSLIVKFDPETGDAETLNSRYKIVGKLSDE